jgi:thiamine-monophosphate kinase
VAVTGKLGAASSGLKILLEKLPADEYKALIKAQLEPSARVKEGISLARSGVVTAAIDVTDGLAANLWQLARESRVKIVMDRDRVPEHPLVKKFATQHGFDVDDFVLFGGEDFELLFTVRPEGWERVRRALERVGTTATTIGRVHEGNGVFVRKEKKILPLPDIGYEHFRQASR